MIARLLAFFSVRKDVAALHKRLADLEQSAITDVDEIAKRLSVKVMSGIRKEIAKAKIKK